MDRITWVGIDHYVPEKELEGFYDSLKEGDLVNLELEPENYWDTKAIAVYYNFIMRGHIAKDETSHVHLMNSHHKELIGRITDDIDRDINEVKILVDSVCVEKNSESDYPTIDEPVLGMKMNPFIMYEEGSYRQIKAYIENCIRNIKMSSLDDEAVGVFLKKIKEAIDVYLTIWDRSLSREANELPRYFERLFLNLSDLSKDIKLTLKPIISDLRKIIKKQPKLERHITVFEGQVEELTKNYSKDKGFFEEYEKKHASNKEFLEKRLKAIEKWLKGLRMNGENTYGSDYGAFVHSLYYNGFKATDLYMIITHLVLMRKIVMWLHPEACNVSIEKVVVRDANFFGKVSFHTEGDLNIDKLIKNNGTIQ